MVYGYIRVSTDKQTVENQRFELERFCKNNGLSIDRWVEETVSGTVVWKKRALGRLLRRLNRGDMIICAELSRLGRSLFMILEILNRCLENDIRLWTVKDGFRLGDNLSSKVLAFAFGLSAEIERNLISQRTREALARRRAEGVHLGRPIGCRPVPKLQRRGETVIRMFEAGLTYAAIARRLKVHPITVRRYIDGITAPAAPETVSPSECDTPSDMFVPTEAPSPNSDTSDKTAS